MTDFTPKQRQRILEELARQYQQYDRESAQWIPHWRTWRRYYDGDQWHEDQVRVLNSRGEPVVTDNVIADKVSSMLGVEIQTRTDIRALPRNPGSDQASADAVTDAIRFVADNVELNRRFSEAAEYEFVEHTGALEVYLADPEEGEIGVKRLHTWQIYFDPTSVELDFSDSRWKGVQLWLDEDVVKHRYPGRANANAISRTYAYQNENYTPENIRWADPARGKVRIFQTYWRGADGEMLHAVWTRGGFLSTDDVESPSISMYVNDRGNTTDPYVWQSSAIDRDGMRYGMVKRMRDLQDEINKRRSKGLHYLNTNQLHYEEGSLEDPKRAAQEGRKPDGVIEYRPGALVGGAVRWDKNVDLVAGNLQLMQDTRAQLAGVGPAEALSGRGGQSGRHLQTQQQGELVALSPMLDRHQSLKRRTYRAIWHRIKQFWTDERWIRVRDSEDGFKFTPLNVPTTALDDEQAMAFGLTSAVQSGQQTPDVLNPVSDMDFDIVLEDVPDVATLAEEQEARLVRLAELGVVFPREVYLEMMSFPNKRRLQDAVERSEEKQAAVMQQQAAVQQQFVETELAKLRAEVDKLKSEAAENMAQAEKARADASIGAVRALTGR